VECARPFDAVRFDSEFRAAFERHEAAWRAKRKASAQPAS
jgi:hypothetical protein